MTKLFFGQHEVMTAPQAGLEFSGISVLIAAETRVQHQLSAARARSPLIEFSLGEWAEGDIVEIGLPRKKGAGLEHDDAVAAERRERLARSS